MIVWNQRQVPHGPMPVDAFLGRWVVGSVVWDKIKRDDPPYTATCDLPGVRERLGRFETVEAAKARVEDAVAWWLSGAGLTEQTAPEA